MLNYIVLVLAFAFMIFLCFVPSLIELRWPKDRGPVDVQLDRDIDERYFSRAFKGYLHRSFNSQNAMQISLPEDLQWLDGDSAKRFQVSINRGLENVVVVEGDMSMPAKAAFSDVLYVKGNLRVGDECRIDQEALVEKDCWIGQGSSVLCLAGNSVFIQKGSLVKGWIDAEEELVIDGNCEVLSRATAGKRLVVKSPSKLKSMAAPLIEILSASVDAGAEADSLEKGTGKESAEPIPIQSDLIGDAEGISLIQRPEEMVEPIEGAENHHLGLSAYSEATLVAGPEREEPSLAEWPAEFDAFIVENFESMYINEIAEKLRSLAGKDIPYRFVLRRAYLLGAIKKPVTILKDEQKPVFMRNLKAWLQAPDTIRVKGDLFIPEGETLPYDLIAERDLESGAGVTFDGAVHVRGSASIGWANQIRKSLVAGGDIELGEHTTVDGCVHAGGSIFVKTGVQVGVTGNGGLAAQKTIYIEPEVCAYGKIYGGRGIRIVDLLNKTAWTD